MSVHWSYSSLGWGWTVPFALQLQPLGQEPGATVEGGPWVVDRVDFTPLAETWAAPPMEDEDGGPPASSNNPEDERALSDPPGAVGREGRPTRAATVMMTRTPAGPSRARPRVTGPHRSRGINIEGTVHADGRIGASAYPNELYDWLNRRSPRGPYPPGWMTRQPHRWAPRLSALRVETPGGPLQEYLAARQRRPSPPGLSDWCVKCGDGRPTYAGEWTSTFSGRVSKPSRVSLCSVRARLSSSGRASTRSM
jgi:hypothetical protein